jgi:hypothetical protein
VKKLQKMHTGLLVAGVAVLVSLLAQAYTSTYAANTLLGANNQVVTIGGTTDGLAPNATTSVVAYSGDGNVILFSSTATNFPGAGGSGGLYAYNINTNATARVDVSSSGVVPNNSLYGSHRISETGRYITFMSRATNLIDGATLSSTDYYIYKRDMQAGATTQIGSGYYSGLSQNLERNLAVSNDGRFLLIASRYVANSYPYPYGIAFGDGVSGTYSWTSLAKGNDIEGSSSGTNVAGGLSCDGAFAVYNGYGPEVKLADVRKGSVVTVATAASNSISPIISCNGRYVLYATTNRTQITPTPSGMNSYLHLVRYDRITGERIYVDSDSSGVFTTGFSYSGLSEPIPNVFNASIADTGDIVFRYNGNAYLKHLSDGSGTLESIATTASGTYINVAYGEITQNGRYIFFSTDPYNLGLAPSPSSSKIIRTKTNLQ